MLKTNSYRRKGRPGCVVLLVQLALLDLLAAVLCAKQQPVGSESVTLPPFSGLCRVETAYVLLLLLVLATIGLDLALMELVQFLDAELLEHLRELILLAIFVALRLDDPSSDVAGKLWLSFACARSES